MQLTYIPNGFLESCTDHTLLAFMITESCCCKTNLSEDTLHGDKLFFIYISLNICHSEECFKFKMQVLNRFSVLRFIP
jgi:hypothetical protein